MFVIERWFIVNTYKYVKAKGIKQIKRLKDFLKSAVMLNNIKVLPATHSTNKKFENMT